MGHTLRKISPKPMRKDWEDIAENFEKQAHFPMCIGAIDGKHIHVKNFPHEGSMCYNYKQYFSFVLLAIADSDCKFIYVDIGAYGKGCDSSILQNTPFWKLLIEGKLNIPVAKHISPDSVKVPYVFVADNAFPVNEHIMRDFQGTT